MSDLQNKPFTDRIASLTKELSSALVERGNLQAGLSEMTVLDQRLMKEVGKSMSGVPAEVLKTYQDMVAAVKIKI